MECNAPVRMSKACFPPSELLYIRVYVCPQCHAETACICTNSIIYIYIYDDIYICPTYLPCFRATESTPICLSTHRYNWTVCSSNSISSLHLFILAFHSKSASRSSIKNFVAAATNCIVSCLRGRKARYLGSYILVYKPQLASPQGLLILHARRRTQIILL